MTESYSGYTIYRTTDDSVIKELNNCKNLSSLTVLACDRFTNANITEALLTNPLERLVISRCPVSEVVYISMRNRSSRHSFSYRRHCVISPVSRD